MTNESEAKMDQDTTKEEHPPIEERIPRPRADSYIEAHELTRMRTRYEEVTADHERAQSRAEFRRSHGPPKGLAHIRAVASDIWTHHISIIVTQDKVRDHLGMFMLCAFSYCYFALRIGESAETNPSSMIDRLLNMWIRGADGNFFCCDSVPLTVRQANLAKSVRRVLLRVLILPFVASYHRGEETDISIYPFILLSYTPEGCLMVPGFT